jgi:catechol 2,3-dioxygenase-like lactoylglutathione lyase family enzyme
MEGEDDMKVSSVSGITFHVRDLSRTAEFYEELGFRRGKEEPGRLTLWVNWFFVTFVADEGARDTKGVGAFTYVKVDDVDDYYNALVSKGLRPEAEPEKNGDRREFVLRDPDGYNLVFFEKK